MARTYVKSSDTIKEATYVALVNSFGIYYMDERDKEWLDQNKEEVCGEGTSAQGAISSTSPSSGRNAKAKGKEPDLAQPVAASEDKFKLVMAIFEKVTHEKTEFLYHVGMSVDKGGGYTEHAQAFEQGVPFPPFSEYRDTFASQLKPDIFAVHHVPEWVPPPHRLPRFARVVYP